ncbi:MAG: phage tail sheath subtilisin-like domain-containing protein [Acetobacter sp.]|uniref:phage tail sheath subtilisin-like domain-containing protein n=1 Tax=Acetobacter sp. TaxID=440 RepID=UPI003F92725A
MSGTITFPNYPASNRVPGIFADLDPTLASTATANLRALLVCQRLKSGTAPAGQAVIVPSVSAARTLFGAGSQAAIAVKHYRNIDTFGELWVLPLDNDAEAIAAKGSIGIAGTPTSSGSIVFQIDGELVTVSYSPSDAPADILARIPTAMATVADIPVSAGSVASGALPLTALNAGECGNDILLAVSDASSDYAADGLTITLTQFTGGTINPFAALPAALASLGTRTFDFVGCPYLDASSLPVLATFWNDTVGRWSWGQELFGHVFSARRGTLGQNAAFGAQVNNEHLTVMPIFDSPHSPVRWLAEITAGVAVKCRIDPGLPITQMALTVSPPSMANRLSLSEQNTLLYDGLSTFSVADDGTVAILRLITTYQTNASGFADDSYLDAETMNQLAYAIRDLRAFQSRYLTKKLVSDNTAIPAGSSAINAAVVKQALISRYRQLEASGYVQNSANFAAGIVVKNVGGGRLQESLPIDVANQVRNIAMLIQFRKS